jgi:deoxyadenosine/deoxycytidine kinase
MANNIDYTSLEEIQTPMLILYEGNIACGKSTLMRKYENHKNVNLMCEPLQLWENFHGSNLLELKYTNREKFEFLFQILAYISRFEQMNELFQTNSVKMIERSLYSSFEVFVEYSNKIIGMNPLEYEMLKYIFEVTKKGILDSITRPDLIVYIRTDSDVCFTRMINRNRSAEKTVTFDVIEELHKAHEHWLLDENNINKVPCPLIILDGNLDKDDWLIQTTKINRKIIEIANIKRKSTKFVN